jgi:uncharacterized caspase-like protein
MRFLLLSLLTTLTLTANEKLALLIGNSNYTHLQSLTSTSKDIPTLAQKLRELHFKVTALYDLDEKSMKRLLKISKRDS